MMENKETFKYEKYENFIQLLRNMRLKKYEKLSVKKNSSSIINSKKGN